VGAARATESRSAEMGCCIASTKARQVTLGAVTAIMAIKIKAEHFGKGLWKPSVWTIRQGPPRVETATAAPQRPACAPGENCLGRPSDKSADFAEGPPNGHYLGLEADANVRLTAEVSFSQLRANASSGQATGAIFDRLVADFADSTSLGVNKTGGPVV
jgi:hypothetical protein